MRNTFLIIIIILLQVTILVKMKNTETHYLLPADKNTAVKLMFYRDSKGNPLPPISMNVHKPTEEIVVTWNVK